MVQVAGGVGSGDVSQQLTVLRTAAPGQLDRLGQVTPLVLSGGGHRQVLPEAGPLVGAGKAAHGGAGPGAAAEVPADDVKAALGEGIQGRATLADIAHPGVTGAAGVDEQRPDPLLGVAGQVPGHRQGDGRPAGMGPVQRHRHARALQLWTTRGPGDLRHASPRGRRSSPSSGVGGDGRHKRHDHPNGQGHNDEAVRVA